MGATTRAIRITRTATGTPREAPGSPLEESGHTIASGSQAPSQGGSPASAAPCGGDRNYRWEALQLQPPLELVYGGSRRPRPSRPAEVPGITKDAYGFPGIIMNSYYCLLINKNS